jgi:hypothetical protein
MTNVVSIDVPTTLDVPCDKVLSSALGNDLASVVVLGWDKDDGFYIAASTGEIGEILLLLEMAKRETMEQI